jgi:gamma-glutamyltranspeptidase/glutathione hydrolase
MVASAHPLATAAGATILAKGGNAADAAAAVGFALAVVEPNSSGLGGGGFATLRVGGRLLFVDFREVAPRAARTDMYAGPRAALAQDGILSVAVPGAVAGYLYIQAELGRLPRAEVLAPALALARDGFAVDWALQRALTRRLDLLRQDPEASRIFLQGSDPPPLGTRLTQPDLAATLAALSRDGADAFYRGEVAARLVADMRERGGILTAQDLADYRVRTGAPLLGSFRGRAVASSPPPSSGGQILLTILNAMERLPAERPWREIDALHTYIEISKRAFADRQLLGDPAQVGYVRDLIPGLIAKDRAALLLQVMDARASDPATIPAGQGAQVPWQATRTEPAPEGAHTTHFCVLDEVGNAVSLTSTINYVFGSGVVARGTGVLWNDEMDDFATAPGVPNAYGIVGSLANRVAPGKVPLSSMAPTLVFEGRSPAAPVVMVVGSPGGSRIPTTVAQAMLAYFDHGMPIDQALAAGRLHQQHLPAVVYLERHAIDDATRLALEARGHLFEEQDPWSNATAIVVERGMAFGAADPRAVGSAQGL